MLRSYSFVFNGSKNRMHETRKQKSNSKNTNNKTNIITKRWLWSLRIINNHHSNQLFDHDNFEERNIKYSMIKQGGIETTKTTWRIRTVALIWNWELVFEVITLLRTNHICFFCSNIYHIPLNLSLSCCHVHRSW